MWKLIKIILIIILIVFGLIFLISAYVEKQQFGNLDLLLSEGGFSQFEEKTSPNKNYYYKEFISPDGNLKLEYLSDWKEIIDKKILEEIVPQRAAERYSLKTLFLAQRQKEQGYSQLIVSRAEFDAEIGFDEVLDIMKEINQGEGWEMEFLESEVKDKEITFGVKYEKMNYHDLHSKEKIILLDLSEGKRKAYIIAFITNNHQWLEFEKEANDIINSAQYSNK